MAERVSSVTRVARGIFGAALTGAASRGPLSVFAGAELQALAEVVLSGGMARRNSKTPTIEDVASDPTKRPSSSKPSSGVKAGESTRASTRPLTRARGEPGVAKGHPLERSKGEGPSAPYVPPPAENVSPLAVVADPDADASPGGTPRRFGSPSTAAMRIDAGSERSEGAASDDAKRRVADVERRAVAVPSSPMARVFGFGQLAAGLAAGTISESARRAWNGNAAARSGTDGGADGPLIGGDSVFMTEANAERLAVALCRMRGAALKLGQMLSIQDETVIPPQIQRALERVRQGADVMPPGQLHRAIEDHLGTGWRERLVSFDESPLAAASIGQVHRAVYRRRGGAAGASRAGELGAEGELVDVCMKIQYPGVAKSIHSDVDNLMRLVSLTDLLPRGLYVDHAAKVAKEELTLECDYEYEMNSQLRMARLLRDDPHWKVPEVIEELCGKGVLTTAFAPGVPIDAAATLPQDERDYIGTQLLRITLRELFEFRFMQTDPNFANFLYDSPTRQLTLIDFGAAKEYPKQFVDDYLRMVVACAERDRQGLVEASIALGFLTGEEAEVLIDAHCEAGFQVGKPFAGEGVYDFAANRDMTRRVAGLGKVMLKHRLTPPPQDAYSLHRKLSGSFLACMRIGARVPAREMLREVYENYAFGPVEEDAAIAAES